MVSLDDEEMQQWMVKSALLAHQQLFRQVLLFCNLDICIMITSFMFFVMTVRERCFPITRAADRILK